MELRIPSAWLVDPAFARAGFKLGMHKLDVAGRLLPVHLFCLEGRTDTVTMEDVDALAEREGFAAALVAAGIAHERRTRAARKGASVARVLISTVVEQLKWLKDQDRKRALAAEAKRLKGLPAGPPTEGPSCSYAVVDAEPDAALAPVGVGKKQQQAGSAEQRLQQQAPPVPAGGWWPPTGGVADQAARKRIAAGEITTADALACWRYCESVGVHQSENADWRAAQLVAKQKPKRKAAQRVTSAVAAHDEWTEEDEAPPWG